MTYVPSVYSVTAFLLLNVWFTIASQIVSGTRLRWKTILQSFGVHGLWFLITALFSYTDSPFKMLLAVTMFLFNYAVVYRMRGSKLFLKTFAVLLCTFGGDIISGALMMQMLDSETIAVMRAMSDPSTILLQCVVGAGIVLLSLLYRGGSMLLAHFRQHLRIGYLLRPLAMLFIVVILFARALRSVTSTDQVERLALLLPDFLVILLLFAIGITYAAQDIRSYNQAKENQQLLHQQSLQSLLLYDTRVFRHNISNMLYGMQGTLLSGDISAIEAYYHQMVEQCQLINNENLVALKRLPSMAVSALLLNKVQQANASHIPFYITVDESIIWRGLRDSEMTQILGVLIDNALEAARESNSPYVAFEACNMNNALSLIIRNTYRPGEPPVISTDQPSTKAGHEGVGLRSIQRILAHNPNVLFNLYPYGRYVEASLLCYY